MPEKKSEKCDEADLKRVRPQYPLESDRSGSGDYYYDDSHGYEKFEEEPEDQHDVDDEGDDPKELS